MNATPSASELSSVDLRPAASRTRRRTRAVRRASGAAAWCVVAAFAFCFLADSAFGYLIPSRGLARLVVPLLLGLLWMLSASVRRSRAEKMIANSVGAFVAVGVLSSSLSVAPELGLLKLLLFLGVFGPLLLCRSLTEGLLPDTAAFAWLRRGVLFVLASALAQTRLGLPGFFTNPNAVAGFVVLATPFLLFGCGSEGPKVRRTRYLWLAVGSILVFGSGSRGGLVSLLAGVLTYYVLRRGGSWRSVLGVGCLVAAMAGMLLMTSDTTRDFAYKDGDTLFDSARVDMLEEGSNAFKARPLLGYGFGLSWRVQRWHVAVALQTGRLSWFVGEFGNATLAILAGGGLLLLACFGAIFACVLTTAYRSLARLRGDQRDFQIALVSGLVGMLVQSQSEAWLMAPMAWATVAIWIYAGLALRCAALAGAARSTRARPVQFSKTH